MSFVLNPKVPGLIALSDPERLSALKTLLNKVGYNNFIFCSNQEDAFDALDNLALQLMVSDWPEVCDHCRSAQSGVTILSFPSQATPEQLCEDICNQLETLEILRSNRRLAAHLEAADDLEDFGTGAKIGANLEELLENLPELPTLKAMHTAMIREALRRTRGHQAGAAQMLGISPQTLSAHLHKHPETTDY